MCNVHPIAYTYHSIELVKRLLDYLENPPAMALGIDVIASVARNSSIDRIWAKARPGRTIWRDALEGRTQGEQLDGHAGPGAVQKQRWTVRRYREHASPVDPIAGQGIAATGDDEV
jgi:hypothetical protein